MKTHYDILGVAPDADYETIKAAYRRALKAHHPDLHVGSAAAERLAKRINAAHAVLKDPVRRSRYDDYLRGRQKRMQLRLATGLTSAAVVASGMLMVFGILLRPDAKPPAPTMAGVKADRVATAEAPLPELSGKGAPLHEEPLAGLPNDVEPDPDDIPAELKEPEPAAAPAEPLQTAAREETESPRAPDAEPDLTFLSEQPQLLPVPFGAGPKLAGETVESPAASASPAPQIGNSFATHALQADTQSAEAAPSAEARPPEQIAVFVPVVADGAAAKPHDAAGYMLRAAVFAAKGDLDGALADYNAAIRLDETSIAAYHGRGMIWQRRGDAERALVDLDHAIRLSFSEPEIYRDRGLLWFDRGNHDRAIADFNQAIKLKPDFADAYYRRGVAHRRKGAFGKAVEDLEQAMRLDPTLQDARRDRDLALMQQSGPAATQ
ncbi:MAG TPA: tetratricopeptide repeat protein [Hyphomicrobiales bacterium]|jgi:curved DNA-binding protein CbpA/Flp pilus assembly protein TadD